MFSVPYTDILMCMDIKEKVSSVIPFLGKLLYYCCLTIFYAQTYIINLYFKAGRNLTLTFLDTNTLIVFGYFVRSD